MLSLIFGNAQQRRGSYPALLRRAGRVPRPNGKGLAPPQAGPAWLRAVSLSEKSPVSAGSIPNSRNGFLESRMVTARNWRSVATVLSASKHSPHRLTGQAPYGPPGDSPGDGFGPCCAVWASARSRQ
jgi:hypothetical protein